MFMCIHKKKCRKQTNTHSTRSYSMCLSVIFDTGGCILPCNDYEFFLFILFLCDCARSSRSNTQRAPGSNTSDKNQHVLLWKRRQALDCVINESRCFHTTRWAEDLARNPEGHPRCPEQKVRVDSTGLRQATNCSNSVQCAWTHRGSWYLYLCQQWRTTGGTHTYRHTNRERDRQPKDSRGELGVNNAQADAHCAPLLRRHSRRASLQRDKANYFCSAKNKTRFDTLYHSVRRQSINKQYNYGLISRQTTTMRVCVCVCRCACACVRASSHATRLCIMAEIRGNRWKMLCLTWQMTNKWRCAHTDTHARGSERRRVHRDMYTRAHTHTPKQICLKSDRSFILSLHSSQLSFCSFSSVHHTNSVFTCTCARVVTQIPTHTYNHTHTDSCIASIASWQTHEIILTQSECTAKKQCCKKKQLLRFYKTNCLFTSDEAPTAGANEYKHGYVGLQRCLLIQGNISIRNCQKHFLRWET